MIIKPKISLGATVFFNSSSADCKLTSCFQVLQQRAPVKSVVYDTPFSRMTPFYINMLVELYRTDLECYAHKRLPRLVYRLNLHQRRLVGYSKLNRKRQPPHTSLGLLKSRGVSAQLLTVALLIELGICQMVESCAFSITGNHTF